MFGLLSWIVIQKTPYLGTRKLIEVKFDSEVGQHWRFLDLLAAIAALRYAAPTGGIRKR